MKELLLVCIGSFFGGGARYLVGKAVLYTLASLALGLIAVIIGYQIVK
jgi:CrcB protein